MLWYMESSEIFQHISSKNVIQFANINFYTPLSNIPDMYLIEDSFKFCFKIYIFIFYTKYINKYIQSLKPLCILFDVLFTVLFYISISKILKSSLSFNTTLKPQKYKIISNKHPKYIKKNTIHSIVL